MILIPKLIQRFWVGSEMPEEFRRYGEQWALLHPDWEVFDWSEDALPELRNRALYDRAEEIAPHNVGQFKADIVRLELLFQFGGVWVDTDFEPLKPIDDLLDDVSVFAAWEQQWVWINNAIMGAMPKHPFIAQLVRNLPESVERNAGKRPNVMTGPQYLTREWGGAQVAGMTIFDQELFYPYSWSELDRADEHFPRSYAVHRWANKRKARAT